MKKIISFDLDGTLVDGIYGEMVWNHGVPEVYAKTHGITFEEAKRFTRKEFESLGDGRLEWYDIDYWLHRFGLPVSPPELLDRYERHIELLPHAKEVLTALQKRYTLIIASNAARIFVEKEISFTGIGVHFTHIVSATSDYGIVKKGETFYRTLLDNLSVSPDEVVHVGDHRLFDYEAPSRFGIESYHLCSEGNGSHKIIHDLKTLLERL
ncbi:MAG TPA: HAD family hydrolase [Syntrophorhabdaceae bacterium]|jgi:putative hydrolase of the HAD superfamily